MVEKIVGGDIMFVSDSIADVIDVGQNDPIKESDALSVVLIKFNHESAAPDISGELLSFEETVDSADGDVTGFSVELLVSELSRDVALEFNDFSNVCIYKGDKSLNTWYITRSWQQTKSIKSTDQGIIFKLSVSRDNK